MCVCVCDGQLQPQVCVCECVLKCVCVCVWWNEGGDFMQFSSMYMGNLFQITPGMEGGGG